MDVSRVNEQEVELEAAGREAYRRSSLFRDIVDVHCFPPFQRLQQRREDPALRDSVDLFLVLYKRLQTRQQPPGANPLVTLGQLDQLWSDADTRRRLCAAWQRDAPKQLGAS